MKNTLLSILAVFATASFLQASESNPVVLSEFAVNAKQTQFIDTRLVAVVEEQIAKALAEPIPASVIATVKAQPRMQFALAKDAKDIVLIARNHS
jgi:hypothetical protein